MSIGPSYSAKRSVCAAQVELGAVSEFMESYELIAFAFADEADGGHEIIAGAVHGGEQKLALSPRVTLLFPPVALRVIATLLAGINSKIHSKLPCD